jgi:hypothetical protein
MEDVSHVQAHAILVHIIIQCSVKVVLMVLIYWWLTEHKIVSIVAQLNIILRMLIEFVLRVKLDVHNVLL